MLYFWLLVSLFALPVLNAVLHLEGSYHHVFCGSQGRRAPSSASGTLLVFTAMILVVVVVAGILSYVSSARGELALQGYNKKSTQIPNRHKAFQ